jgi:hypothetical protein
MMYTDKLILANLVLWTALSLVLGFYTMPWSMVAFPY